MQWAFPRKKNPPPPQVFLVFATRTKTEITTVIQPLDTVVLCRTCRFSAVAKRHWLMGRAEGKEHHQSVHPSVRLIYNQYISVAAAPLRLGIMARYFNNLLTIKIHLLRNRRASGARYSLTASIMRLLRLWGPLCAGRNKSDGSLKHLTFT